MRLEGLTWTSCGRKGVRRLSHLRPSGELRTLCGRAVYASWEDGPGPDKQCRSCVHLAALNEETIPGTVTKTAPMKPRHSGPREFLVFHLAEIVRVADAIENEILRAERSRKDRCRANIGELYAELLGDAVWAEIRARRWLSPAVDLDGDEQDHESDAGEPGAGDGQRDEPGGE